MYYKKKISTNELILLLKSNKRKFIEASLNDGIFNATHFIWFGGKMIYDMGIDSNEVKWNISSFQNWYQSAYWRIDQIVG